MVNKYIDLHTHTNYSDGIYNTPQQLVGAAACRGIDILAKTDHDTLNGIVEAKREGEKLGVLVLSGVEITTPKYHLLALGFHSSNRFRDFIKSSEAIQEKIVAQRIEALKLVNVPITLDKVKARFPESRLGKYNLLWTCLEDEGCREYFAKTGQSLYPKELLQYFFGKKGVALIDKLEPEIRVEDAVREVHAAGGIIGIAHPEKDVQDVKELEILVKQGIDFIERQPNIRHLNPEKTKMVDDFVERTGMPVSYGSDYHGTTFSRPLLERDKNILSEDLAGLLRIEL